jgi:HSP20 family molecular chaperone IbpA
MVFYSPKYLLTDAVENFISDFFYSFPESPKPPTASRLIYEDTDDGDLVGPDAKVIAFEIQMAVAGFNKEDIKVSHDNRVLTIKGTNKKDKSIVDKLSCTFEKKYAVNEIMDLSNTKVKLKNGLLSVIIPIKIPEKEDQVIDIQ